MNLTKDKFKSADIAVDTIDFIEQKVHNITHDDKLKEKLINSVLELISDHYNTDIADQLNKKFPFEKILLIIGYAAFSSVGLLLLCGMLYSIWFVLSDIFK